MSMAHYSLLRSSSSPSSCVPPLSAARRPDAVPFLLPAQLPRLGGRRRRGRSFSHFFRTPPPGGEPRGTVRAFGTGSGIPPPLPEGSPGGLPLPDVPLWARVVLGAVFCLAIPFYKRFRGIEEQVEATVETVADVAEGVAEVAKKVAEEIAEVLPEAGNLKKVVMEVEEFAEEVKEDAEQAKSIIHKVEEIQEEVETAARSIIRGVEELEEEGR